MIRRCQGTKFANEHFAEIINIDLFCAFKLTEGNKCKF